MRNHADEGETDGKDDAEADVQLPKLRDLAAEYQSEDEREAARDGDFLGAVAVQEITDHRRQHRIDDQHDGEIGGSPAAPAESIEQRNIKYAEGRMDTAGKTQDDKSQ